MDIFCCHFEFISAHKNYLLLVFYYDKRSSAKEDGFFLSLSAFVKCFNKITFYIDYGNHCNFKFLKNLWHFINNK